MITSDYTRAYLLYMKYIQKSKRIITEVFSLTIFGVFKSQNGMIYWHQLDKETCTLENAN